MKYFLISDNVDTLAGMRLVGVRGVVVHEEDEVRAARPLIVEMPDRHSDSNPGDSIKRYISEVVGVKI